MRYAAAINYFCLYCMLQRKRMRIHPHVVAEAEASKLGLDSFISYIRILAAVTGWVDNL